MNRLPEYKKYNKITKYMTFELIEKKPKTTKWLIFNNRSGSVLGGIEYYPSWRQYVFLPEGETVFNDGCLKDIVEFLGDLNYQQKHKELVVADVASQASRAMELMGKDGRQHSVRVKV